MGGPRRSALAVALLACFFGAQALPSFAQETDPEAEHAEVYELASLAQWNKTHLSVLVVPPLHGPVFNEEGGVLNGGSPAELTPFNTYLKAIEDAIDAWDRAVDVLGEQWLKEKYQVDVYVAGRDQIPPDVLAKPDILVFTDEDEAGFLGTAVRVVPCLVRMSMTEIESFTYADMYNVTEQEFGHCLGLHHVGGQGGVDPTSDLKHPEHDVMNGFYSHSIGAAETHLHCISNLDILALEWVFSNTNVSALPTGGGPGATSYLSSSDYGDVCDLPPVDWRVRVPDRLTDGGEALPPTPDELSSTITRPLDGSKLKAKKLEGIEGTAQGHDEITDVSAAVARRKGKKCSWWSQDSESFLKRPCDEPYWNEAYGTDNWFLALPQLPKGVYVAMSSAATASRQEACCDEGTNQVAFELR